MHGEWCTQNVHRDGSISRGTSHGTTKSQYTAFVNIKNTRSKRIQSLIQNRMRHVGSESAREQTIALYMKAMNNNNIHTHRIIPAELTSEPQSCLMGVKGCKETIAVWTLGMPGDCFHREVGFRFGKGASRRLAIQVNACFVSFPLPCLSQSYPFPCLSQSYPFPCLSQNYPFPCLSQSYPFLCLSQNYPFPCLSQNYPFPCLSQNYPFPCLSQSYPFLCLSQNYPFPRLSQNYPLLCLSQNYPILCLSHTYPFPCLYQNYPFLCLSQSYPFPRLCQNYPFPCLYQSYTFLACLRVILFFDFH